MKYLPIRDIDILSNALNFSTPDCHVIGSCDLYTTKAAGGDKKLYKSIETSLESQYESLVRLSASLSPPLSTFSEDGRSDRNSRTRSRTIEPEIDLSRSSPFGPLSQISSRRTFAYLIATLNASHPDYDFSHLLRPADFKKERSLRTLQHTIDSTLAHLRPRQTAAVVACTPPTHSFAPHSPVSALGNDVWTPHMWKLLDAEMTLRACEKYSYVPADDPFEGPGDESGALWSLHYFFFNKERKRVAYLYLRAFSVISHSPVNAPTGVTVGARGDGNGARGGAVGRGRREKISARVDGVGEKEGAGKRASYWLGNDASRDVELAGADDGDDDEMEEEVVIPDYDDEIEVPFMNLDDIRSDLVDGRLSYARDDEDEEFDDDYDGYVSRSWSSSNVFGKAQPARHVRGISEEIGEAMDMDD